MNVEIFSAAGGMAEGFRRAGLRFDIAVEKDPVNAESYRRNLGVIPLQADARELADSDWTVPGCRLLVADPPCTPWSMAGKRRGLKDPRDCMEATCKLVERLAPAVWIIANVPGLDTAPNWPTVQRTIGDLAEGGYCIDYWRLDAADYGVPQHRVRPFWIGHRPTTPCFAPPPRTHGPPTGQASIEGCSLKPWVTCALALGHLSDSEIGVPKALRWKARGDAGAAGPGEIVADPKHPPSPADAPAHAICGRDRSQGGTVIAAFEKGRHGSRRWPWDRPATSATCRNALGHPGHHDEHARQFGGDAVVISERAAAILQGFPEEWKFCGTTKGARWSQIGQAMPPPLAHAVARAVVKQMTASRRTFP